MLHLQAMRRQLLNHKILKSRSLNRNLSYSQGTTRIIGENTWYRFVAGGAVGGLGFGVLGGIDSYQKKINSRDPKGATNAAIRGFKEEGTSGALTFGLAAAFPKTMLFVAAGLCGLVYKELSAADKKKADAAESLGIKRKNG